MSTLDDLDTSFQKAWPAALTAFSPFTRLAPPILCRSKADEKREGLEGSFAMIRMKDQRIVISLPQIQERHLGAHAHAILAHEVGHYVHAPGTLEEQTRLLDRIRRTLPESLRMHAGMVANLYTDLLLNDRLQRSKAADVAAVYAALAEKDPGKLWRFYVRTYERLWALPTGTLGPEPSKEIEGDADLAARIVRHFRDRWLEGAPSFAILVERYLADLPKGRAPVPPWLDTAATSAGDRIPDGMTDDDFDPSQVKHPAYDDRLTDREQGDEEAAGENAKDRKQGSGVGASVRGDGRPDARTVKRGPQEWLDLMRAIGVERSPSELVGRYYRELAMPHVIPFPSQRIEHAGDPLPEGLDPWDPGGPLERLDWFETLARSPVVIPGVTTVERAYGVSDGGEPERRPPDLYLGIDCSGSMGNPAYQLAYPIVASAVLTLSALRAGARVMACLSGEAQGQGNFVQTDGFIRDEAKLLGVLTDYLGTGWSFGLSRLVQTFVEAPPLTRPAHVVVVSDTDFFNEVDRTKHGWELAKRAVERAGAGATAVLRLADPSAYQAWLDKLHDAGFESHCVASEEELVSFARAFARRTFVFADRPASRAASGARA